MRPYEAKWFDETGITTYNYEDPYEFMVTPQDGSLTLRFKHANIRLWLEGEGEDTIMHVRVEE